MPHHDLIVIGTSWGGVEALKTLFSTLPHDLPATVLIVMHMSPKYESSLSDILARHGGLTVSEAQDGEPVHRAHAYVAKPDHHLLIENQRLVLGRGPRENHSRPSVDVLFRSAATAYGPRVIGVILTGQLDDGSAGLWSVKRAGGIAVVQDPADAERPGMPTSAMQAVDVDHCVPLREMATLLTHLVGKPAMQADATTPDLVGVPVLGLTFVCPDCQGPLSQVRAPEEKMVRFRCHIGHAYSVMSLLAAQTQAREQLLWTVVRTLEDEAVLTESALKQGVPVLEQEGMHNQSTANKRLALRIRDELALIPHDSRGR